MFTFPGTSATALTVIWVVSVVLGAIAMVVARRNHTMDWGSSAEADEDRAQRELIANR